MNNVRLSQPELIAEIRRRLAVILAATEVLENDQRQADSLLQSIERSADECFELAGDLCVQLWQRERG